MSRNESNLHISELLIDNVTLKDNGTYQCYAENSVGYTVDTGYPYLIVHGQSLGLDICNKHVFTLTRLIIKL